MGRWRRTPLRTWKLLAEAAFELFRAQVEVRFFLKRSLPALLQEDTLNGAASPAEIHAVRRAVQVAVKHVPWTSICLPNAMAASRMLSRRGIPSRLHLGVGVTPDLHAHAWVVAQGVVVTGRDGMDAVQQITPEVWVR